MAERVGMGGLCVRSLRRPIASVVVAAVMVGTVAVAPAAVGAPGLVVRSAGGSASGSGLASRSGREAEASEQGRALAVARRSGRRVEVVSLRSETGEVFANPGGTLTLEEHAQPVRVRRGGGWVPVDTTLREQGDGTVAPMATVADVRLSGGGDAPLVRLAHEGREVAFGWPGRLPRPALAGDTATYPRVLPGVDLRVRVEVGGFSEVLVVKTRAAGRNPALSRVRLTTVGRGVRIRAAAGGGLDVVDTAGRAVFSAGRPWMWDAGVGGGGGRRAAMGLRVGRGDIAVLPDRRLLADRRTRYPVVIDPSVSLGLAYWGNVVAQYPYQAMKDDPFRSEGAKAGYGCDSGCFTYRSVFQFGMGPLAGKHVLKAIFAITLYHSWSCSDTPVELWNTGGIADYSTWNSLGSDWSAFSWYAHLEDRSGHAGANCDRSSQRMEFGGSEADNDGLQKRVQNAASGAWSAIALGLKAPNEGDVYQWKRFLADATLAVDYNSYPNTPDQITVDGKPCATGTARPYVISTTPLLRAHLSDPDPADQVGVQFVGAQLGGTTSYWASQDFIANGLYGAKNVPAGILADGKTYFFQAQAADYDGTTIRDHSAFSASCEFTVDATPPKPAKGVVSTDGAYPQAGFHGVAGRTGRFTLTPPDVHPEDVAFYLVAQSACGDPTCAVRVPADATSHAGTVDITPSAGTNTLMVWTQDLAGNLGAGMDPPYQFSVRMPSALGSTGTPAGDPAGSWSMNEGAGTTAADGSGHGNTVALLAGAMWASPGHLGVGSALSLGATLIQPGGGGGPGTAATAGPVVTRDPDTGAQVAVRTDRSFTVAAWVRLNGSSNWATAVAQDGSRASGFYLQYNPYTGGWSFSQVGADADNPVPYRAQSTALAQVGKWTHLVGVYDASTKSRQLRLYVNGKADGTALPPATPWNATGSLTIGRAKYNGGPVDYWPGSVDEVRVYDRVLSDGEVAELANAAVLTGRWDLGEGVGTTAADTSGFAPVGNDGTLPAGASWVDVDLANARESDGKVPELTKVVNLDGSGGIVTKRAAVDTSQSFTVTAWVRLTSTANWATAVAQDGSRASGFYLQYNLFAGRWSFSQVGADADNPVAYRAVSVAVPQVGTWTHLAGVYDASTRQLALYVDGKPDGTATLGAAAWNATGPLTIGRAKYNGVPGDHWPGDLASVRVYGGVLSDAQIKELAGVS